MKIKNKKPLIALALVAFIGTVLGTVAYYTNTATFSNIFKTKPYSTEVTEHFESPEDWTPGTTTDKTITVKNTGEVDVAVRVKFEGSWQSAKGTALDGKVNGSEEAAILNFAEGIVEGTNENWEKKEDGYYYYKKTLAPQGTTETLLESVTFNKNAPASESCSTSSDEGAHTSTTTCTSDGTGYDGATYTLKVTIETIQADAKDEVWKS